MIVSTVLFVLLAATLAALTVAWLKRLPTLHLCPTCAHRTQAVLLPGLLRPLERWIARRWCADCEWEGIARRGPEFVPGRPLAHDSGFHWGVDLVGENAGFHWAELEPTEPPDPSAESPAHRSGFRFASGPAPTEPPAHRSGFRFGSGPAPTEPRAHRSGFTWSSLHAGVPDIDRLDPRLAFSWGSKPRPISGQRGFQWSQPPLRHPPHPPHP